ncbi:MAG TPA: hypothetical protein DCM05_03690 [Elusimicrobia bacterium]|nr:hypothetical protein [Elusimicrobiota bacterium]
MESKDPEAKIEIRPQTMRQEEEERKGGGFLAALLSKLGLGGSAGGSAGLLGTGFGGGIIATKAGIVALVMVGATVAAGISILGPAGGLRKTAARDGSVFTAAMADKGGDAAAALSADGKSAADASQGGASGSLDYLANANPAPKAEGESVNAANDAAAGSAVDANAASDAPASTTEGEAVGSARSASAPLQRPQMVRSQGLGAASSGAGSSAVARMAPQEGVGGSMASFRSPAGASKGGASAMRNVQARSAIGRSGGVGQGGRAARQLAQTSKVVKGNLSSAQPSSQGSGLTYDGAATNSGAAGAAAAGAGVGGQGLSPGSGLGNPAATTAKDIREVTPPAPAVGETENQTPYQNLVYAAIGCMVASLALMYFAGKVGDAAKVDPDPISKAALAAKAKMLSIFATIAAGACTLIGIVLTQEPYNQMMQGIMFTVMGGILTVKAAMSVFDSTASDQANAQMHADANSIAADKGLTVQNVSSSGQVTATNGSTFQLSYNPASTTGAGGATNLPVSENLARGDVINSIKPPPVKPLPTP